MKDKKTPHPSAILAVILSLVLPGLGQAYLRRWYRGLAILLTTAVLAGIIAWFAKPVWFLALAGVWLWNVWDAASLVKGKGRSILIPVLFGLVATYGIGWQVVGVDFSSANLARAAVVVQPMLHPDMFQPRQESNQMWTPFYVPCSLTVASPTASRADAGKTASAKPNCAGVLDAVTVSVSGLWPNTDTTITWQTNIGDYKPLGGNENASLIVRTDVNGSLTTIIHVPSTVLIAQPDPTLMLEHRVYFDQYRPLGGIELSTNGGYVLKGMLESVTMALLATTMAILLAVPVSFLAARNLMGANPLTFVIYIIVRTILNFVRSIESLIIAIVFVIIVGLGPFAGVMALAFHSVAALAKLYSEVIEGIDPGPIEAIRATGGNWLQVVRYGVIPQIVPPFTAFTIYRWDINVRSSIVIGMVGGGGIGFYLIQWIQINQMGAVGSAFIAIAVVVITLDYLSAKVRERLA